LMLLTDTINFIIGSNAESFQLRGLIPFISSTSFAALMFALFFSFIFFKKENDKLTNLSVVAALPAFFLWSFVYYITRIFEILNYRYDQNPPAFMSWMYEKQPLMEMFFVGWFAILFTWILMQRYALLRKQLTLQALDREKEKTELINRQKEELEKQVEERTSELKNSIEELKTTQKQLIHSEKMASLGELTAGIAHEIQNPLNFVNNFSEVNTELIDEMQNLVKEGNTGEALELAADLKANLEKINFHGKRADSIVKNMLQHSRKSTGNKEPADLNALTDEYLRLSYHGLRAKDKSFNATIETHYDPSVGKVDIISQDFGRVLLNLFNNAFYSVAKKKQEAPNEYQPTVMVSTQRNNNHVEIKIRDNGLGIPKTLLDKIYQPFFTTKPTGEGTGLGLSLSYDIVTKAHGGQIKFDTQEGEFAEFRIALPVENNK
ncbi:MAG TPA: ATP-binding protein, partial [Chitinophagaceae bacterium]